MHSFSARQEQSGQRNNCRRNNNEQAENHSLHPVNRIHVSQHCSEPYSAKGRRGGNKWSAQRAESEQKNSKDVRRQRGERRKKVCGIVSEGFDKTYSSAIAEIIPPRSPTYPQETMHPVVSPAAKNSAQTAKHLSFFHIGDISLIGLFEDILFIFRKAPVLNKKLPPVFADGKIYDVRSLLMTGLPCEFVGPVRTGLHGVNHGLLKAAFLKAVQRSQGSASGRSHHIDELLRSLS